MMDMLQYWWEAHRFAVYAILKFIGIMFVVWAVTTVAIIVWERRHKDGKVRR